ncbi:MAG: methyltransferase domain-containing protein [Deltaproteobacteria bacterium]|nr:methyltransferase domain-containing protein [Deltaproteobacteria bacterium]
MKPDAGPLGVADYDPYVRRVRENPDLLDRLLFLWNAFDLPGLRAFFAAFDPHDPYKSGALEHRRYAENRGLIAAIVRREDSYLPEDGPYLKSETVSGIYSASAFTYDALWDGVWSYEDRAVVVEALELSPGESVLEVGIGTGNNLKHFPPGCRITGIDLSPAMLSVCRRKAKELSLTRLELFEMDAGRLPFTDGSFDKVLCFYSLCCTEDPSGVLQEIARVCSARGTFVVYDVTRSDIPEVRLLQYLYRPIGRDLGAVYLEFCPPGSVTYDACIDLRSLIPASGFTVRQERLLDPFRTVLLGVYEKAG